ncbi:Hypothetical predicted protein [Pelobates cultripes]|uniref:Uncharacterized protein n=1 Tax=Pelobates cultripes TaxID=61616 RepID=A0AAD1R8X0_PELCU|nr:Hypothetical predicted protein [Pelobates cultripes]CAH2245433.1 Hypothetical predicted protein [Pelobates cultripes]
MRRIEELMEDMVRAIRRQIRAINRMSLNLTTQMDRVVSWVSMDQRQMMEHMRLSIIEEIVRRGDPSSVSSESEPVLSAPMIQPGTREGSHRRRGEPCAR